MTVPGKLIKLARESRSISLDNLASQINMLPTTLKNVENGLFLSHPSLIGKISIITKYPISFFYQKGYTQEKIKSWNFDENYEEEIQNELRITLLR